MTHILTDLSPAALAGAIRQNMLDLCWEIRQDWRQAVFNENRLLRRWWSPIPIGFIFNAVVSLQPPGGDEAGMIGETISFFQSRGRQEFDWWLSPGLESSDWGRQLEAQGLKREENMPGMAVDLSVLPEIGSLPAGMKIETIQDAGEMRTWSKTFIAGYGLPPDWEISCHDMMLATLHAPLKSYMAVMDGQAVAVSSLYLGAGVAGIYNVATLPEWRGKGIGAALTLQPLLEAHQQGYRAGILQSSELGYKVYQRLGFKELCKLDHYHWQEQA